MNAVIDGDCYIEAMNASASDRASRQAFQNLALSLLANATFVLDFGCGPGIDAKLYARHGHRVCGYDIDPGMRKTFSRICAPELSSGSVVLDERDYREFIATETQVERFGLITANFAPINLVPNVHDLFSKFSRVLVPGGLALLSVLNPFCAHDSRYRWWWRNIGRLIFEGSYAVPGGQAPVRRWRPDMLAEQASPALLLDTVYRGLPETSAASSMPRPIRPSIVTDWPALISCRFLFVLFRSVEDKG